MVKWSAKTDFLSGARLYGVFVLYLFLLQFYDKACSTEFNAQKLAINHMYLYLQFIAGVFVFFIAAAVFEETFRTEPKAYLRAFCIPNFKIIFIRYLRLLAAVCVPYLAAAAAMTYRSNRLLHLNFELFQTDEAIRAAVKDVSLSVTLGQCFVAVNFYICAAIFLSWLFSSKSLACMAFMAYWAFDMSAVSRFAEKYCLSRGAFCDPDYSRIFVPNIIIMAVLSLTFLAAAMLFYKRTVFIFRGFGRKKQ